MKKPALLILAAGIGSRYGGLKQIDTIGPNGEAIIDYSIYDAIRAGFGKIVLVIREELRKDFDEFFHAKLAEHIELFYVYQSIDQLPDGLTPPTERIKPWGTAHAILQAAQIIDEPFMVINADDYYSPQAFQAIASYFSTNTSHDQHCMVGYPLRQTLSDFGTVARGVCQYDKDMFLKDISEITNIQKKNESIGYLNDQQHWIPLDGDLLVSMNAWGFYPEIFHLFAEGFRHFIMNHISNPKAEYFIALPIREMINQNKGSVKILLTDARWFGITYRQDKEIASKMIQQLIQSGLYPSKLWG